MSIDSIWDGIASLNLDSWTNIATIIGILIATVALSHTACQINQNTKISRGQFWLELEKMFSQHDKIHIKLRSGGAWANNDTGPKSNQEWAEVEDYMGLFEHCELMLRQRLIDWETFEAIFAYRLRNIAANKIIVEAKLMRERQFWQVFIRLLKRLEIDIPE